MPISIKNIILLMLMLVSASLGAMLKPTYRLAEHRTPIDLEVMVPKQFGDWQVLLNGGGQVVNPQQKQMLDQIYSDILTRTYVNQSGYRIMLSIAYGNNQSDALQLHRPESCYPAQGFVLRSKQNSHLTVDGKQISSVQLETNLGLRFEPVTYWTVVGDYVTTFGFNKKVTEMRYAWNGEIPDGMLIRVSSIDRDTSNAFAIQREFAAQFVDAISMENRNRFVGSKQFTNHP
jgi:EpsI family protein